MLPNSFATSLDIHPHSCFISLVISLRKLSVSSCYSLSFLGAMFKTARRRFCFSLEDFYDQSLGKLELYV